MLADWVILFNGISGPLSVAEPADEDLGNNFILGPKPKENERREIILCSVLFCSVLFCFYMQSKHRIFGINDQ